jgi:hypothetical protein
MAEGRRPGVPEAFALIGAASFLAARFLPLLDIHLECPFRLITGLPCASCGMTHAFVALSRGELAAAWSASPLGAGLAGGAWLYALLDLGRIALGLPWPSLPQRAWRAMAVAALSAAAFNWAWMLFRGRWV